MHSMTKISHAGLIFDGDFDELVRLPTLLLFLGLKSEFNQYSPGLQLVSNSFSKLKKYSKLER